MDRLYHDLTITPYTMKIPSPFCEKKGLILSWINEKNQKCLSDISPLKGFSQESYEEVLRLVTSKDFYKKNDLTPSLDFALHHPIIENEIIKKQKTSKLILSEASLSQDLACFSTIKIKTTLFEPRRLISIIKENASRYNIRLDANRQKLDPELKRFLQDHPNLYSFIEEPIIEKEEDKRLKIALDETLYLEKTLPKDFIPSAIVYKPTLCGSIHRIKPFLDFATQNDISLIISSSFESEIGIAMLLKLMDQLDCHEEGGLDTFTNDHKFQYLSFNKPYYEFHKIF
jgi:O-succinylbenzoate synthase